MACYSFNLHKTGKEKKVHGTGTGVVNIATLEKHLNKSSLTLTTMP